MPEPDEAERAPGAFEEGACVRHPLLLCRVTEVTCSSSPPHNTPPSPPSTHPLVKQRYTGGEHKSPTGQRRPPLSPSHLRLSLARLGQQKQTRGSTGFPTEAILHCSAQIGIGQRGAGRTPASPLPRLNATWDSLHMKPAGLQGTMLSQVTELQQRKSNQANPIRSFTILSAAAAHRKPPRECYQSGSGSFTVRLAFSPWKPAPHAPCDWLTAPRREAARTLVYSRVDAHHHHHHHHPTHCSVQGTRSGEASRASRRGHYAHTLQIVSNMLHSASSPKTRTKPTKEDARRVFLNAPLHRSSVPWLNASE
ncbi:hypothetical protein EYF80_013599 [Liparis tanakae]|uniref:Uncharacterized protein n=1 Tax=Liparis tanakae TaxID=230148 RepID=A0A4Z2IDJ2_9TELE|nr:hypothetical protein EYF80_013599 [Liparis tanakae]